MITVGILGYGYWGPNLLRNLAETPDVRVLAVADPVPDRLALACSRHPGIVAANNSSDLIAHPAIDAVVIATPVATHFELALAALRAGKHVLVEKPLAASSDETARLIDEASRARRVLMVDHTFVYSSPVREMRRLVADGTIGDVVFYDAMRMSLARFQPDVGVLWDLAVHDLSILDYVVRQSPTDICAAGHTVGSGTLPDVASVTLLFDGSLAASIQVNWQSALKVRRTFIGGRAGTIVYDDAEASEKVRVYESSTAVAGEPGFDQLRIAHRAGGVWAAQLSVTEPLRAMAAHFVACVESGARPDSDGESGLRVIRWLEAATQSIAMRGRPVSLQAAARL